MKLDHYDLKAGQKLTTFEFLSEGPKGKIIKGIQFQQTDLPHLYNLAFGDKNLDTGELDDKIVTGNGDSEKVLATVVTAIYAFVAKYPDVWIYATGNSRTRTRLYRMGINKHFKMLEADFEILAADKNQWESYDKNRDYGCIPKCRLSRFCLLTNKVYHFIPIFT